MLEPTSLTISICRLPTLNTVRLSQLRAVNQQRLANAVPSLALGQPNVNMCGRKIIDVEPHIFVPAVFDQLLIYTYPVSESQESRCVVGRDFSQGLECRGRDELSTLSLPT